jgi:hypothetical protein
LLFFASFFKERSFYAKKPMLSAASWLWMTKLAASGLPMQKTAQENSNFFRFFLIHYQSDRKKFQKTATQFAFSLYMYIKTSQQ